MNEYLLPLTSAWLVKTAERPAQNNSSRSNALIIRMLMDEFHVDEILINALRPQGPGCIEARRVLSVAKQMGGINSDNVRKVMDMRREGEHKKTWIEITRELGVALDHRTSRTEGPARGTT